MGSIRGLRLQYRSAIRPLQRGASSPPAEATSAPQFHGDRQSEQQWADDSWLPAHHHHGRDDAFHPQQQPSLQISSSTSSSSVLCSHDDDDEEQQLLHTLCENGHTARALDLLSRIHTAPPTSTYMSFLKACIRNKAPAHARQVHDHLAQHSSRLTPLLGDYLVVTLAKCGAVDDACQMSHTLPHRTVLSWTAMISAFVESGRPQESLKMYQLMQEDGVEPDSYTFVSLFKACGSIPDLEQGKKLHAIAREKGFTSNVFVGNTLVSMYGKCGNVLEAEDCFGDLLKRNIVSWNAMLSAYIEEGEAENALQLYRQMQEEGMIIDQFTLMFALQACGTLAQEEGSLVVEGQLIKVMSVKIGEALHAKARMKNFASDVFVGTALIIMYGKCGAIMEAEDVLGELSQHDTVSWNAMLSAYIQQCQGEKALQLYIHMQKKGSSPDQCTLVFALQACGSSADEASNSVMERQSTRMKFLEIGQALHADACRQGFALNVAVGNSLVRMYGKCGAVMEAEHVFGALSQRDVVSWSVMLSAYVDGTRGKKAVQLYRQMLEEGVHPDQHVLMLALQACGTLSQKEEDFGVEGSSMKVMPLEIGQALFVDACRKGFVLDVFVGNTLVSVYGKCGGIAESQDVFVSLLERDVVSWTAMLSAYVEHGQGGKALQLYRCMQEESIIPNQLTFVIALHACGILADKDGTLVVKGRSTKVIALEIARALHSDAHKKGYTSDILVGNTLVTLYGKCGSIMEAEDMFDTLSHQDVVAWNAMLSAYIEQGQGEKALWLYRQMQKQHVTLDDVAVICLLHACSETGNLEICKELHFNVASAGHGRIPSLAATFIHAYGSCASMVDGQIVLDGLLKPDTVSWTACIAGHAGLGNCMASMDMFERLRLSGFKPDEVLLTLILLACSNTGCVVEGLDYFESTSRDHGTTPNLKHYGLIVDLLGRSGDFKRVENVLARMPMQADVIIWLCLLSACHTHGNLELAKQAFDHAVLLEPKDATVYVVMSNIYADAGLQECAAEMENCRRCLQEACEQ